jgi:hypothetical protein
MSSFIFSSIEHQYEIHRLNLRKRTSKALLRTLIGVVMWAAVVAGFGGAFALQVSEIFVGNGELVRAWEG